MSHPSCRVGTRRISKQTAASFSPLFVSYMRGVRREAVFIVMRYKNTDLPDGWNIRKYRPIEYRTAVPRHTVLSLEMDGLFRIVCGGTVSRQAVGTTRLAARGTARQAGMGDGEISGTKNGATAIKQSSRVILGGPCGTSTRDLRIANPLLSRLS